jgi:hypothetical protein
MKPIILKPLMPIAVFVLGILGAFATTSMQSTAEVDAPVIGYADAPGNACSVEVQCDDEGTQACYVDDDPNKAQAFIKDGETTCVRELHRPQ